MQSESSRFSVGQNEDDESNSQLKVSLFVNNHKTKINVSNVVKASKKRLFKSNPMEIVKNKDKKQN